MIWHGAAKLRAATTAEHAIRHAACDSTPPDPTGVAATMAAARKALAAKPAVTSSGLPAATRLARSLAFTAGPTALRPALEPLVAGPVASLPRRPRAP